MDQYEKWAQESVRRWDEAFSLAEKFQEAARAVVAAIDLERDDHAALVNALLYGRVLSGTRALVLLAQHGLLVEADSQFRSNMEALFRLAALVEDESMLVRYLGEDFPRRRQAMADVRSLIASIPKSDAVPTDKDIDEVLSQIDRESNAFIKRAGIEKIREVKTWEWVKVGRQADFFWGKYVIHSGVTHHSARDLERRMRLTKDGQSVESIIFHQDTESPEEIIVDGLYLLARAMDLFARAGKVELSKDAYELKRNLDVCAERVHRE